MARALVFLDRDWLPRRLVRKAGVLEPHMDELTDPGASHCALTASDQHLGIE